MHNRTSITASALALFCTFLAAPVAHTGESAHLFSPTLFWFCQSSTVPPAYTSTVVVTVASGRANETILPELVETKRNIEKSFADFLARKYGYAGLSSCNSSESKDWMESSRNERLEALRSRKLQVVETGWVYEGAASMPTATAPVPSTQGLAHNAATGAAVDNTQQPDAVPPAKPAMSIAATPVPVKPTVPSTAVKPATGTAAPALLTPYAFCFGEVTGLHQTVYFGVPFKAPARDVPAWSAAYKAFLHDKYRFSGTIHCPTHQSLATARQQAEKAEDRYRAHWKIVETGWKYQ